MAKPAATTLPVAPQVLAVGPWLANPKVMLGTSLGNIVFELASSPARRCGPVSPNSAGSTAWTAGRHGSFIAPAGAYEADSILVRYRDEAGNIGSASSTGGDVVVDAHQIVCGNGAANRLGANVEKLTLTGSADTDGAGNSAANTNVHVLYETDTGKLFYDADGSGSAVKVLIATLTDAPTLAASHIFVT